MQIGRRNKRALGNIVNKQIHYIAIIYAPLPALELNYPLIKHFILSSIK